MVLIQCPPLFSAKVAKQKETSLVLKDWLLGTWNVQLRRGSYFSKTNYHRPSIN
jgi:hypothetical protein